MEAKPKKSNDKVLETTTHEYLKKDYTVVKELKDRKILYTGSVKISDALLPDKIIKHICKRKKSAKEKCKREIKKAKNHSNN